MASIGTVVVKMDTSELEAALERMRAELTPQIDSAPQIDPTPMGLVAAAAVATASTRPVTRRSQLGLGWLR
jgi:hypothetical protein